VQIQELFDPETWTLTYVVYEGNDAVVIDSVLDYDPAASQTSTESIDRATAFLRDKKLELHWILETHPHADHLSGAQLLKKRFGGKIAIGEHIRDVQETFKKIFDMNDLSPDGKQFDHLLRDGEVLRAGALEVRVIATPGHTPACVTYHIGDAIFTGDALVFEDYGSGRCDFPRGSADDLYTSVHDKLYALPDATRVFPAHDYLPGGRAMRFQTTIGVSKETNIQLRASTTREDFVAMRLTRDKTLKAPKLLFPSVQVNIDAGRLPKAHTNGIRYLSMPINSSRPTDDTGER
jgi:glyoxylase-like metal-dependent hydrolase (beta-lactamase superfamily II)